VQLSKEQAVLTFRILCNNRHSRAIALAQIALQEPWPRNQSAASRIRSEPRRSGMNAKLRTPRFASRRSRSLIRWAEGPALLVQSFELSMKLRKRVCANPLYRRHRRPQWVKGGQAIYLRRHPSL